MTRDEVRNLMHDYYDSLLSAEDRSSVESYLEEYEDLLREYELLGKLLEKAHSLPIGIKTPDTIVSKISDELLSKSLEDIESTKQQRLRELTEQVEREGEKRKKGLINKKGKSDTAETKVEKTYKKGYPKLPLILILVLIICVGGYFAYNYFKTNLPWKVKAEYGQYQIGSTVSSKKTLDENETLSTLDSTRVSINVPNAGRLVAHSFSSLQLIKGNDNDNVVSLISGKIEVNCKIDNPSLRIKTNPVDIIAKGGDFSIEIEDQGDVDIQTANGVVKLQNKQDELLLIQDHNCKVLSNGSIGIPFHINANSEFVAMVSGASLNSNESVDLEKLLKLATPLDGITLLYLIKKSSSQSDRLTIFLRLNEFYPVPPSVTQYGIINLDSDMFEKWREEIEWQI